MDIEVTESLGLPLVDFVMIAGAAGASRHPLYATRVAIPESPGFIKLLKEDLPLIIAGPIAAGIPILADEHVSERIPRSMAEWFPRKPDFFVRVEGDSMGRLGIVSGTVVAVKSQPTAVSGDVIVAVIEEQVTLKRFVRRRGKHAELLPESTNLEHQPIAVDLEQEGFEIAGVAVRAVIGDGFNRPGYETWSA